VNHCVVVKRAVVERHPWVALNVYDAFVAASDDLALAGGAWLHPFVSAGLLDGGLRQRLAADPWAYGLRNSSTAVETILRYLREQELLGRPVTVEELFAPSSLGT
jgi:4,5-dihydroxyphthalate decarboxylase